MIRLRVPALVVAALALMAGMAVASSVSFWEMTSFTDFIAGRMDGVALSRDGHLTQAPQLETVFNSGQPVIWSVVPGPDGALYAATGHRGRVYRIDSQRQGCPDLDRGPAGGFRAGGESVRATSLRRVRRTGKFTGFAADRPRNISIRNRNTSGRWRSAPDGALYAGTGSGGLVYQITAPGQGEQYYATGQGNVTGLIVDHQGRLLAGTEPNGVLYRITAKDKAFALYDSSLPEIRALATMPDGTVYAAGLGGALAKKIRAAQQNQNPQQDATPTISTTVTVTAQAGGDLKPTTPADARPVQAQNSPALQPTTPAVTDATGVEKSAIYRINPDNTVDTLWSSKEENVYDISAARRAALFRHRRECAASIDSHPITGSR